MSKAYDEIVLTPTPEHGRLRQACEEGWFIPGILWGFGITAAFMWPSWFAWSLCAFLGVLFVFTIAATAHPQDTDRDAFTYAAITTGIITIAVACAWGLGVWVGGMG